MVLGELVLRPIPTVVAHRVAKYAEALGVKDDFVRVARRYAQGAYGLAWKDLQRNGFVEHVQEAGDAEADAGGPSRDGPRRLRPVRAGGGRSRARGRAGWRSRTSPRNRWATRCGRCTTAAASRCPARPAARRAYLAQHDFVHVLADYGTNLKGELEVFAFIGRADPDPKGFAWLATLTGLFETGYIPTTGFFDRDVRERVIQAPGMHQRVADAIRRGKVVCQRYGVDLFEVDYYDLAARPVAEVREMLGVPPKGPGAVEAGSRRPVRASKACPRPSGAPSRNVEETPREPELQPDRSPCTATTRRRSSSCSSSGISTRPRPTSWATWASACWPTARTPAST